jgi:hypothetical protein
MLLIGFLMLSLFFVFFDRAEDDDQNNSEFDTSQQRLVFSSRYRFFVENHMEIVTDF